VRLLDVAETAELNAVAFVEVGRLIIIHASRGCEHTKFLEEARLMLLTPSKRFAFSL
jgi:hypothetical protein